MASSVKINLPCKLWKCDLPMAVVSPVIEREDLCGSEGEATSDGISSIAQNSVNLMAAWRESTYGRLSTTEGATRPWGVATDQQSGDRGHVAVPWRSKVTVPRTPAVLKRRRRNEYQRPMSFEERELSTIARLQRETAEHRQLNEAMMRLAIAGTGRHLKRNSILLPRPINVQLSTSRPVKGRSDLEYKEYNFIKDLRMYPPSTHVIRGCTVPKPFNLSCPRKRECESVAVGQYISRWPSALMCFTRDRHQKTPGEQDGFRLTGDCEKWDR